MGTLTVRENIMFSANLRLPSKTYSKQRVKDVVEKVIEELGLESCANTLVSMYVYEVHCFVAQRLCDAL